MAGCKDSGSAFSIRTEALTGISDVPESQVATTVPRRSPAGASAIPETTSVFVCPGAISIATPSVGRIIQGSFAAIRTLAFTSPTFLRTRFPCTGRSRRNSPSSRGACPSKMILAGDLLQATGIAVRSSPTRIETKSSAEAGADVAKVNSQMPGFVRLQRHRTDRGDSSGPADFDSHYAIRDVSHADCARIPDSSLSDGGFTSMGGTPSADKFTAPFASPSISKRPLR